MHFRSNRALFPAALIALGVSTIDAGAAKKAAGSMLPVELSDIGYVEIEKKDLSVPVNDAEMRFEVGERMPLIQANKLYYIALLTHDNGHVDLVAVRKTLGNGQGSAWVTKEGELIFGSNTHSASGLFYLRPSEILPIVFEDDETFLVLCERNNHVFSLEIEKSTKGYAFIGELSASVVQKMRLRGIANQKLVIANSAGRGARKWDIPNTVSSDRSIQYGQTVLKGAEFSSKTGSGSRGASTPALSSTPNRNSTPSGSRIRVTAPESRNTGLAALSAKRGATPKTADTSKTIRRPASSDPGSGSTSSLPSLPQANSARKIASPSAGDVQQIAQVTPDTAESIDLNDRMRIETTLQLDPESSNDGETTAEDRKLIQETNDLLGLKTTADSESAGEQSEKEVTSAALKVFAFFGGIGLAFLLLVVVIAQALNRRPKPARVSKKKTAEAPPPPPELGQPQSAKATVPLQAPTPPALLLASESHIESNPETRGFTQDLDFPTQESFDPGGPYTRNNGDDTPYQEITIMPESPGLSISELAEGSESPGGFDPDAASLTEAPGESQAEIPDALSSTKGGTFTGSLCGFNISALIQFLNSSQESGTLSVTNDANHTQSKIFFENGEIVNAEHGSIAGEEAVAEIFRFDDGFFVFKRQAYLPGERVITISTMSLLMNVSQSIDEEISLDGALDSSDILSAGFDTSELGKITSDETPYFRKAT